LPEAFEEVEPAFYHTPADDIPCVELDGVTIRVMMGDAFGVTSPVKIFSPNMPALMFPKPKSWVFMLSKARQT